MQRYAHTARLNIPVEMYRGSGVAGTAIPELRYRYKQDVKWRLGALYSQNCTT